MVLNFRGFVWSAKIFTANVYNMDERQVSLPVVVNQKFTLGCGFPRMPNRRFIVTQAFFCVLNFRGWFRPRNYFNSEIFPIYGTHQVPTLFCSSLLHRAEVKHSNGLGMVADTAIIVQM